MSGNWRDERTFLRRIGTLINQCPDLSWLAHQRGVDQRGNGMR
jgi:hypothetical protein